MKNSVYTKVRYILTIFIATTSIPKMANAQIVGADVFIKGLYCEIGSAANGAFGSVGPAPVGFHPRADIFGGTTLGFVADVGLDGWTVGTPGYIGDYFLPGDPQEGWSIQRRVGNEGRAWRGFGGAGTTGGFDNLGAFILTGANTGYGLDGRKKYAVWEGTYDSLYIRQTTTLDTTKTYFVMEVKIKNLSSVSKDSIYYNRTVDPDNEAVVPGAVSGYSTINTIVRQPGAVDNKCLVSAVGQTYSSYLGLGTVDCRARCYVIASGLRPTYGLTCYHSPPAGYLTAEGATNTADKGVGVVFNVGTLGPGDSTSLKYAYILNLSDLDSAFAELAPTFLVSDSISLASTDTVYGCVGDSIPINIVGGGGYQFTNWSPAIGLVNSSGPNNIAIVQDSPITYTATGNTLTCNDTINLKITVAPRIVDDPGLDGTGSICGNAPILNVASLLGGTPAPGGVWSGPGVSPTGFFNPAGVTLGTYTLTYTTNNNGCTRSANVVLTVINDVDIDFTFDIKKGCTADTVLFTNNSGTIFDFNWNFGDGSPRDSTNFNPTHIYPIQEEYAVFLTASNAHGCRDSVLKLVDTRHPLHAGFTQSGDSMCQGEPISISFADTSIGNISTWAWDFGDGNSSNLQNPTHHYTDAGVHTVRLIVTDDVPCSDTAYGTIYVDSIPFSSLLTNRDSICKGDQINISADYLNTATSVLWDFGDGSSFSTFDKNQLHSYGDTGTYYLSITTTYLNCPPSLAHDTIYVKPYPVVNLGADSAICLQGEPIRIAPADLAANPPGTIYHWSTGIDGPIIYVNKPGTYRITADLYGCVTNDEIMVKKDCYIDIPNSFTPNEDGLNDYFFPRNLLSKGLSEFTMTIFNRWGMKIFETSNIDGRGWDGRYNGAAQPEGVYIYQIAVKYKNGAAEKYTGNVTLLR